MGNRLDCRCLRRGCRNACQIELRRTPMRTWGVTVRGKWRSQMSKSKKHLAQHRDHGTVGAQTAEPASADFRCETIDELMDVAAVYARELFAAAPGRVYPFFIYQLKGGELGAVLPRGWRDKDELREGTRQVLKEKGAERYVFITEVWTSALLPKDGSSIASNSDCGEAVMLYAEDREE